LPPGEVNTGGGGESRLCLRVVYCVFGLFRAKNHPPPHPKRRCGSKDRVGGGFGGGVRAGLKGAPRLGLCVCVGWRWGNVFVVCWELMLVDKRGSSWGVEFGVVQAGFRFCIVLGRVGRIIFGM